jgi:hypothetical protein
MSWAAFAIFLGMLLVGHGIGDAALQPSWLSEAKRPERLRAVAAAAPGAPGELLDWPEALCAHAAIHRLLAGDMLAMAGAPAALAAAIALAETIAHGAADFLKCRGAIGTAADQGWHVGCKVAWAAIAAGVLHG